MLHCNLFHKMLLWLGKVKKMVQIDFSAAIWILLDHCSSNHERCAVVDGCQTVLMDVISGVTQGSVLGPILFIVHTADKLNILENQKVGYADDTLLMRKG